VGRDQTWTESVQSGVEPVVAQMRDGRLWFSTIRGLLVIDPGHLERRLPPPPVTIEDVIVDGQRRRPADVADLPAGSNNLEFRYTGLSFVVPTRITFRYTLEGFDRTWMSAGSRRQAFYTNLPPGHFRFRVAACNSDGECSETSAVMAFAIGPRYYQRA
jgi:hypothetical protein